MFYNNLHLIKNWLFVSFDYLIMVEHHFFRHDCDQNISILMDLYIFVNNLTLNTYWKLKRNNLKFIDIIIKEYVIRTEIR